MLSLVHRDRHVSVNPERVLAVMECSRAALCVTLRALSFPRAPSFIYHLYGRPPVPVCTGCRTG